MINLIQTEFSKLKRQKTIFIITGVLLLFWAGMTFWNFHVPQKSFEDFYMKYSSYLAMLLPFLLGLLFIKIYHAEYQNDFLKELLQIPVSMNQLFYAKILFSFLAAVIIMLLNCLLIVVSAVICRSTDIGVYQILMLIRFFLLIALAMPFTMFPVFLVTALVSGNTIFSSTVCFIYSLSGIIGISQLAGTHPLSSMLNILFGNQLSSIATDGKNLMYIVDVMLFVFITVVSVKVFYKVKRGDKYKQDQEDYRVRKWNNFKEFCVHVIMGIDIVLIGILLIPMKILFMIISAIWESADKIIRRLEVKI